MKHYHLNFSNEDKNTISQIRYENIDEAAIAFVDMCFYIYPQVLDEMFKSEYIGTVYRMLDDEEDSVVMIPSRKLTVGVMRCPYERCASATNN